MLIKRDTLIGNYYHELVIRNVQRPKLLWARKSQHNLFSCTYLVLFFSEDKVEQRIVEYGDLGNGRSLKV